MDRVVTEDSVRLLTEIANLMYQITEFMLSRQKRLTAQDRNQQQREDENEGGGDQAAASRDSEAEEENTRSDMVPDMLKKVLAMVAHLVRVKKELAVRVSERFTSGCAQNTQPMLLHKGRTLQS